jgi:hypothetical protein
MWTTVMQLLGRDQNGHKAGFHTFEPVLKEDT